MSDFSLITHQLPDKIVCGENVYVMDTRTCKAIQCFLITEDTEVPEDERMLAVVTNMLAGRYVFPGDFKDAYRQITEWLNGYPSENHTRNKTQLISLFQDHNLIVAAFRQQYGISLKELKSMHWWEFLALLSGISEDTRLGEVMKIRGMEISAKDTPEQRQAKIKAKNSVAIRKKKAPGETGMDIISAALESEG